MECQFCNKQCSTKGNLLAHQMNTKYCIKLQEENKPREYICEGCEKKLSNNHRLQHHQTICKKYNETNKIRQLENTIEIQSSAIKQDKVMIEKLENHVKELENKLFEIALKAKGKTTTITNNIQQNFTPITDEKLKAEAINFTKEHLLLGGQGIARYAIEGPLKDNYLVTDVSRGNTQYMNEDGKIVLDPCSAALTKRICQSIVEPAQKINREVKSTLSGETPDLELTRAVLIEETVSDIRQASKGVENTVTREFAKTISKSNIKEKQ